MNNKLSKLAYLLPLVAVAISWLSWIDSSRTEPSCGGSAFFAILLSFLFIFFLMLLNLWLFFRSNQKDKLFITGVLLNIAAVPVFFSFYDIYYFAFLIGVLLPLVTFFQRKSSKSEF